MMRIVATANNFGYGPASALIDIISATADFASWCIYSAGQALDFLQWNLPNQEFIELDVWKTDNWHELTSSVPPGVPIVVISHPQLVRFLVECRRHVIHIDQLDWMWPVEWLDPTHGYLPTLHLIQPFLTSSPRELLPHQHYVRPIWHDPLPSTNSDSCMPSKLILALGGMGVAGVGNARDQYGLWLVDVLSEALALLGSNAGWQIHVIGGSSSFADRARHRHPEFSISRGLVRAEYLRELKCSGRQVLSPGLASIYETAAMGLTPFFQPAANMSMLLQMHALQSLGYRQLHPWPWQDEALHKASALSELDLLAWMREQINLTIADTDFRRELVWQIAQYLENDCHERLAVPLWKALPSAAKVLREHLVSL